MEIKRVGVIGGGIMGSVIEQVCASHGYELTDIEVDEARAEAPISGIGSRSIDTRPRQRGQQPHPAKLTSRG